MADTFAVNMTTMTSNSPTPSPNDNKKTSQFNMIHNAGIIHTYILF